MNKKTNRSQFIHKLVTATAVSAMLLSTTLYPVSAGITVNVNQNGSESENGVDLNYTNQTSVSQTNNTNSNNTVDMDANTGGNEVTKNTGSDIAIQTGSITTSAEISNSTGTNAVNLGDCTSGCANNELGINVNGNGSNSETDIDGTFVNTYTVDQSNAGSITNKAYIDANTGYNKAKENTSGDISIKTGSITGAVNYNNTYGSNLANTGNGGGWGVSVDISGNGSYSETNIDLNFEHNNTVNQQNDYWVHNVTNVNTNTGGNECIANTSGSCEIMTGDIIFGVDITNTGGGNDTNIGGISNDHDDDDDTDNDVDDDDQNNNNYDDEDEDDKSIIDKIIDTLIPDVHAETDNGNVKGVAMLPDTGFGTPMDISWYEVFIAFYLVLLGGYVRHLAQKAQLWAEKRSAR